MDEPLILNRYRLIERLASGGSAEVWRAHDEQLDRMVAVKRLHPHLLPDEASRRRLAAEARAVAGLSHPVIVDVYDVDATGDVPALIMELVDGESLSARIDRDGRLPPRVAAAITADLADALYHAHQRGVIHRDVKPGNVLLAADGRTRLVDFGIAHSLAEAAERLTVTGTVIGTLRAMAPEQLAGGPITPRTDLYGLGVVLHEACTGRPPYPAGSPVALAEAQRAGPPALDGIDPGLAAVIAACLAGDPANRPLHAGALAAALRDWLAGEPAPALAMAPPMAVALVDTAAITQPVPVVAAVIPAAVAVAGAFAPGAAAAAGSDHRLTQGHGALPWIIGLVAAAVILAVIVFAGYRLPALADPSAEPSTPAVATQVPTEAPTQVALPPWAARLAGKYAAECGTALDPSTIAGLDKKQAEELIEPQIDACEEARND